MKISRAALFLVCLGFALVLVGGACQKVVSEVVTAAKGTLAGQVIDNPVTARPGATHRTYSGIAITIVKAVPIGSSRQSADSPERITYKAGDKVAETVSGPEGRFSVELPVGTYFVRGFGGEKVYSGDVFAEIKAGSIINVKLLLNFGV